MALFFGSSRALLRFLGFLEYDCWIKHSLISLRTKFQVNWNGSLFWLQMSSMIFLGFLEYDFQIQHPRVSIGANFQLNPEWLNF